MPMPMPSDLLVLLFRAGLALVLPKKDTTLVSMSRARQPVSPSVRQPGVYRIWLYYIFCCDLIDCCHADGKETLARVAAAGLGAAAAAWLTRLRETPF